MGKVDVACARRFFQSGKSMEGTRFENAPLGEQTVQSNPKRSLIAILRLAALTFILMWLFR